MHAQTLFRLAMLTLALLIGTAGAPGLVTAQESTSLVRVTATDSLLIRDCPLLQCPVLGKVMLGDALKVIGDEVNGFLPVEWNGGVGYAYRLYLDTGNGAPWFVEGTPACKQLALVFNIGIGYEPSGSILQTLRSTDTAASMFPMGWWALTFPEYLLQIDAMGFDIGTHGDQPIFLTEEDDASVRNDIQTSVTVIETVIGRDIDPYFTPYAADTDEDVRTIAADLGLLSVGWNVAANDYGPDATEDAVYQRVMSSAYPGAVVEMHLDGPATETSTALALPRIIADLEAQGYTFVPVSGLVIPCDGVTPT